MRYQDLVTVSKFFQEKIHPNVFSRQKPVSRQPLRRLKRCYLPVVYARTHAHITQAYILHGKDTSFNTSFHAECCVSRTQSIKPQVRISACKEKPENPLDPYRCVNGAGRCGTKGRECICAIVQQRVIAHRQETGTCVTRPSHIPNTTRRRRVAFTYAGLNGRAGRVPGDEDGRGTQRQTCRLCPHGHQASHDMANTLV